MSIPEGDQFGCGSGSTLSFRDRLSGGNKFLGLFFFYCHHKKSGALCKWIEMTLFPKSHVKRAASCWSANQNNSTLTLDRILSRARQRELFTRSSFTVWGELIGINHF